MNIGLNLLFCVVTTFQTVRYACTENPSMWLMMALIGITIFGYGGLYLGIRSARRQ